MPTLSSASTPCGESPRPTDRQHGTPGIVEMTSLDTMGLANRILRGEVVVLRQILQRLDLYELLREATLKGIRSVAGDGVANNSEKFGFDRIHEWVDSADIPLVTDAVSREVTALVQVVVGKLIPGVFPDAGAYYFERNPNVRFHIPYDLAAAERKKFEQFSKKRGEGKITAHGPHRDPWVDCPANAINVWIAVGPVQRGNGLTVFTEEYRRSFPFSDGYVMPGARLHKPLNFELQAGDAVLFHSNHLHGSELNRTERTRYVVSYRITFGKPYYPHGHYHHYLHGGLAAGPLRWLAHVPQNLQASFFRYQLHRLKYKLTGKGRMTGSDAAAVQPAPAEHSAEQRSIALADFPVGSIRAVSKTVCIARLATNEFAAVTRRCPHMGGDLVDGWIDEGQIVCPLHSLTFDPRTGASPCRSLQHLRCFQVAVNGERAEVLPDRIEVPRQSGPVAAAHGPSAPTHS